MFGDSDATADPESVIVQKINRSLSFLNRTIVGGEPFLLFDLSNNSWRRLLAVRDRVGVKLLDNMDEWLTKHAQKDDCEGCESEYAKTLNLLMIAGYSCLLVTVVIALVAVARKQLLKKRVTKGPYKVLLTATDFVFPQIPDSRRVSGCCFVG